MSASLQTAGGWSDPRAAILFDADLVPYLMAQHAELSSRVAALDFQPGGGLQSVRGCASQLSDLRRLESLRLYPAVAHLIDGDTEAQRQFLQLRLAMLSLARRFLRCCDDLAQALASGSAVSEATDKAAGALGEYRRRNETEIYPLYELMGRRHLTTTVTNPVAVTHA